jgi:hypothetical protein
MLAARPVMSLPAVGALVPGGLPSAAVLLHESLRCQRAQGLAQVRRLEPEGGLQFGDCLAADRKGVVDAQFSLAQAVPGWRMTVKPIPVSR